MKLDVVVPTYNRSHLLKLTVASLLRAPVPEGLDVTVIVVDNNSKDDTRQVVEEIAATASRPVVYVKETEQGSSQSRNAGIRAGKGEIIGFIDDDEEIDPQWYAVVAREFGDSATQFIGGPYLPNCSIPMPEWLPPGYNGVIGVVPPKPREAFSRTFPGNLQGGNAVLRRTVYERVGFYSLKLGRTDKGLQSEEDAEFYRRILDAGLLGYHVPDLIIYHYIPESRLTRSYHRSWCYWRGVSLGVADAERQEAVTYLWGIPRYRIANAGKGLPGLVKGLFSTSGSGANFARELALWDLAGFVRGKYFKRFCRDKDA